jgi:predicted nuclease of predicted toxin-antitoxin system
MRTLIDECVDERLRHLFPGHDCQTARFAGLAGLKNGRLLDAAEAAGFNVLLTVDQNIPDQQNLSGRNISLMILCGRTNRLSDLARIVPAAITALDQIASGAVVRIRENA